jgi:hypothetical protein
MDSTRITLADVLTCPEKILMPTHYRDDGSCGHTPLKPYSAWSPGDVVRLNHGTVACTPVDAVNRWVFLDHADSHGSQIYITDYDVDAREPRLLVHGGETV